MTVTVTFLCPDGVVLASDSMLTPSLGGVGVGHHTGRKVYTLPGEQIFGLAGDLGLAMRVKALVEPNPASAGTYATALDYCLLISKAINEQFAQTRVPNHGATDCFVAFPYAGSPYCCAFTGALQPHLLDGDHYYMALGSGKLSADPFLKFLVDIFCQTGRPNVHQASFLAVWTVQHTIETTQGGVDGPIRIAVLEGNGGTFTARELPQFEIDMHLQSKQSAEQALRDWRHGIQSGAAAQGTQPVPVPTPAAD